MKQYADWKAPTKDASHLIWPSPGEILDQTRANAARLRGLDSVRIQNASLAFLRRQLRSELAVGDEPLIATGHQVEMYHPGVWVKNILIDQIARKTGGKAIHFAVDTDTPKHLQLKWPGQSHLMSDDIEIIQGEWSELVASPSEKYLSKLIRMFERDAADWRFKPAIAPFFDAIRDVPEPQLCALLVTGAKALDESLGLDVDFILATRLIESDAYLAYVHHITADIEQFAIHYNRALADYRTAAGIQSTSRPMPDLRISDDRIELPFWLDDLQTHDRVRATAVRIADRWAIVGSEDDPYFFDPAVDASDAIAGLRDYLSTHQLRLSPRALTLTMFFRLMLVDQFVHGIGGARYDQVSDRILHSYFGIEPPDFSVTTATLYFPNAGEQSAVCVPCVVSEGHHLKHNLIPAKQTYLNAINAAPPDSIERKTRYLEMHRAIATTIASTDTMSQWKDRLERTIARQEEEKVLFNRELFYGVQSAERLSEMIQRYREAF